MLRTLLATYVVLLALLTPARASAGGDDQFVGTWHLVSWARAIRETVEFPYGRNARGMIIYTPDGMMSGALMASERDESKMAGGYLSYSGSFVVDLDAKTVSHNVEMASIPEWVGMTLVREFEFETPEFLVLSLTDEEGGRHSLRWVRRSE